VVQAPNHLCYNRPYYAETNLSAVKSKTPAHPGISRAQSNCRRPQGFKAPPPQTPPPPGGMTMLPQPYRLPGCRIIAVLKSSQSFHSPLFTLKILKTGRPSTQIGIIVPVKVSRLAVVRNHHKRLVSEAIKPYLSKFKPNHELIFLAKPAILKQSLSAIQADLLKLLKACSLLN